MANMGYITGIFRGLSNDKHSKKEKNHVKMNRMKCREGRNLACENDNNGSAKHDLPYL